MEYIELDNCFKANLFCASNVIFRRHINCSGTSNDTVTGGITPRYTGIILQKFTNAVWQ